MKRIGTRASRPVEYSILIEPRPAGPQIGNYYDRPIAERVIDAFGRRFDYIGAAPRLSNGRYDVASLEAGEFIVEPGLVYRLEAGKRSSID